jgi:hypothetical protein
LLKLRQKHRPLLLLLIHEDHDEMEDLHKEEEEVLVLDENLELNLNMIKRLLIFDE